jgi:carbamoyl-phosphate synthase large subunit
VNARDPLTVLVLGVGGNVSQGILKALALAPTPARVVAACVEPSAAGLYLADAAYISPLADDPDFVPWLLDVVLRERVDAILSGVEPVLAVLAAEAAAVRERTGAVCVVSRPETLEIGQDKLRTCQWLEAQDLPCPAYADAADAHALAALERRIGYPLLAKPRWGKGGEGISLIDGPSALAAIAGHQDLIVQELLGDASSEYTAGCFCDVAGVVRGTIVMRRTLHAGTTYSAELGEFPEVRDVAERIAAALRPVGPCNVQLRVSDGRPIPFELNVRFSGTTPLRARVGFNEVDAALRHLVLLEPSAELRATRDRGLVLRYWNEVYVPAEAADSLTRLGTLGDSQHPGQVENWGFER